jgi:hypothetical protein
MFDSHEDLQDYVRTKTGEEIPLDVADYLYRECRQWNEGDEDMGGFGVRAHFVNRRTSLVTDCALTPDNFRK